MFELDIKPSINIPALQLKYLRLGEHLPRAVAKGMTDTVKESTAAVRFALPQKLDRPTPWTRRSLFFFPAEHNDLRAAVAFKWEFGRRPRSEIGLFDAPQSLAMQVHGGDRKLKQYEKTLQRLRISPPGKPFLIPAEGCEIDRYGNVPRAFLNKVFYSGSRGGSANINPFSGGGKSRGRDARAGIRYFVHPNKTGIYRTVPSSSLSGGRARNRIIPVFIFSAQPHYRSRFDFYGIANRGASGLERHVDVAIARAVDKYLRV